jgi:hypothetical protein
VGEDVQQPEDQELGLPRHLASLVGSLNGPADLGRNHDHYLAFGADGDSPGGTASA